jgi:hypothetical protein
MSLLGFKFSHTQAICCVMHILQEESKSAQIQVLCAPQRIMKNIQSKIHVLLDYL